MLYETKNSLFSVENSVFLSFFEIMLLRKILDMSVL